MHTSLHSPEHKYHVCGFAYTTKPWYGEIKKNEIQTVLKKKKKTLYVSINLMKYMTSATGYVSQLKWDEFLSRPL